MDTTTLVEAVWMHSKVDSGRFPSLALRTLIAERLPVEGVSEKRLDRFLDAFESVMTASRAHHIAVLYGEPFVKTLVEILFGRDPLLTLLCPTVPNRRILLCGERGVGKERLARVVAQGLTALSGSAAPMVSVNAAALPDTLLESTLFGHVKGAFTGAVSERAGLIERLHPGGVLFFDEASSASAAIQAKLLRVFQSGEYAPVGAPEQVRRAHIHVIAATNADPEALRSGTAMRADLFDRLAAPMIPIPPLRQLLRDGNTTRAQDIFETLAIAVIRDLAAEGQPLDDDPGVVHRPSDLRAIDFETWATPKAARMARRLSHTARHHTWPGNLREAAQLIRQSLFISPSSALSHPTEHNSPVPATRFDIDPDAPLKTQLEAFEGRLYAIAASKHGSFQDIGESLGVTRQTASRRMHHFDLVPGQALEVLAQPIAGHRDKPEERQLEALLERETETDPAVFEAAMVHYLDTLRERARTHRFIDLSIAERIATSLRALAEGLGDDPAGGKMICAATRYFMEVEDDDHDFESVIGLDDDAAVVNAVARRLGRLDCLVSLD